MGNYYCVWCVDDVINGFISSNGFSVFYFGVDFGFIVGCFG